MKLGLVSAIMEDYSFEEMIDFASENGLECVEVACWPQGKGERRYAGVTHIDVDTLTEDKIAHIKKYIWEKDVEISALAYYPNPLDANKEKQDFTINHLKKVIKAAADLDVNMVTTFIGRDQRKTVAENLELVKEVWLPILHYAEKYSVKIAIENCPMLFTEDEWPGGQNLMTTPAIWRKVFSLLDSPNLGLNFDPSHFVWQQLDYLTPIYEFKDKLFFVHFKDIKLLADKLKDVGIMALPLDFMVPKLPGYGDIDWGKFVSALTDIGYDGPTSIEIEDKAFEGSREKIEESILHSICYLRNYV